MDARLSITRSHRPEVGRLWIRRAFRDWPATDRRRIDLGEGGIARGSAGAALPDAAAIEVEGGLLYVPAVDRERAPERDALVAALAARGAALLVQLAPGETLAPGAPPPEAIVIDLLEPLLERRLEALDAVSRGAITVWPLVAALTDDEALWEEACRRLRAAGAACAQALVVELLPEDRRELGGDQHESAVYSRLVHGRAAGERRFAATAARHGLAPFFRRRGSTADRRSRNAALAELLALGGELWLRLGRGEVQGQELFRASRWVDDTSVDVRALAAEGNLEIVEALRAATAGEIVGEWARSGASPTVERWIAEYVGSAPSE